MDGPTILPEIVFGNLIFNLKWKHIWENNVSFHDLVEQPPTIHTSHLNFVAEFVELALKDFDYQLKAHPAHSVKDLEQLNV